MGSSDDGKVEDMAVWRCSVGGVVVGSSPRGVIHRGVWELKRTTGGAKRSTA